MYWLQWSAGTCRATHAKWHPSRAHYWQYSAEPYFFLINDFHVSQFFSMLLKARNSMKKENPNCGSARYGAPHSGAVVCQGLEKMYTDLSWRILSHFKMACVWKQVPSNQYTGLIFIEMVPSGKIVVALWRKIPKM